MGVGRAISLRSAWQGVLAAIALLVVLGASATGLAYLRVGDAVRAVEHTAVPAQSAAAQLTMAYVNQGTAELGYILSDVPSFLVVYTSSRDRAAQLQADLSRLLADDSSGLAAVERVAAAGAAWRADVAAQNTTRQQSTVDSTEILALAGNGRQRFAAVLSELGSLTEYTRTLTQHQMSRISAARRAAAVITGTAVAIVLTVIVLSLLWMRRIVDSPMSRLLGQVRGTADGTYDAAIDADGPQELVTIAVAVESMRRTIVDNTEQLVARERELALRDERDRLAADLHDLTVQRVFAIGLALRAVVDRHPELHDELDGVMDEAEHTIQELRGVIYGISRSVDATKSGSEQIEQLVHESTRFLGFEPSLRLDPSIDEECSPQLIADLTATLREALSNAARHARASAVDVAVEVVNGQLQLGVSDDGRGISVSSAPGNGLANMRRRAERLGGTATFTTPLGGGTRLDWQVPLATVGPATVDDTEHRLADANTATVPH